MSNRDADLQELRRDFDHTSDPKAKRLIEEAGRKIQNESGWVRSARDALIAAHRRGDKDEIKNIHQDLQRYGR